MIQHFAHDSSDLGIVFNGSKEYEKAGWLNASHGVQALNEDVETSLNRGQVLTRLEA